MFIILLAAKIAYAGCTKDTDCKGDRVCEAGTCVGESGSGPARKAPRAARYDAETIREATRLRAAATRGQIFGYSFGGGGAAMAIGGSALGLADAGVEVSTITGGIGLVGLAAGGPLAASGGSAGRRGLLLLDAPAPGRGLPIAGWSCYGTGMLLGVVAVGVGISGDSAGGAIGLLATTSATAGVFMLAADAGATRARLDRRLQEVTDRDRRSEAPAPDAESSWAAALPGEAAPALTAAPWVAPASSGAIVGLSGTF